MKIEPRLKCTSHPSTAGEWDINICAKSAGSSQAAATPASFAVASDVLNGHLWWGESPRNDFLSGKEDWRAGKHTIRLKTWKVQLGAGKTVDVHAFLCGKSPVCVVCWKEKLIWIKGCWLIKSVFLHNLYLLSVIEPITMFVYSKFKALMRISSYNRL